MSDFSSNINDHSRETTAPRIPVLRKARCPQRKFGQHISCTLGPPFASFAHCRVGVLHKGDPRFRC